MSFVARHIRLTNSGKLPDLFLTSKIQQPSDLADAKLGKLSFVLQINSPWNHVASMGSSIVNIIGREYYRQEGSVPLENFEKAIAKANRLIEQLKREGETHTLDNFHALIALAVGDEVHIAYTGDAEAYFLRDDKIGLITDPGRAKPENGQVFNNLITGEISNGDTLILGSPGLYEAITPDDLRVMLKKPVDEGARDIARRLRSMKMRKANAILLHFSTLKELEENPINSNLDTIYLDQAIDTTWDITRYYMTKVWTPIAAALSFVGRSTIAGAKKTGTHIQTIAREKVLPQSKDLFKKTAKSSEELTKKANIGLSSRISKPFQSLKNFKPSVPTIPELPKFSADSAEDDVHVNHYTSKKRGKHVINKLLVLPLKIVRDVGKQFRKSVTRNPRLWAIVVAVILLGSLAVSVQNRQKEARLNPVAPTAALEEMKGLLNDVKSAKAYGNEDEVRRLLSEAITKGEIAKQNSKLAAEASSLLGQAQRDLDTLSGATRLESGQKLLSLPDDATHAAVYEGIMYYTTNKGALKSILLTGGETTTLGQLPDESAVNQLSFDTTDKTLYLQTYRGNIFTYTADTGKLTEIKPAAEGFVVSTGMGLFAKTLYLLDPANGQIWKHTPGEDAYSEAVAYLRSDDINLSDTVGMAIDGSVFVLHKSGAVSKFTRGNIVDFTLNSVPAPFDTIPAPLAFAAVEDGNSYYVTDRGSDKVSPRIIEFDKTGKFVHQFFLPNHWQKDLKLVVANPKTHKAWVLVNKDLYEFTLVQ